MDFFIGAVIALITSAGAGYFEVRVQEAAFARVNTGRHLTATQKKNIVDALAPKATLFPLSIAVAAPYDPESTGYAIEIMLAMKEAHLKVASSDIRLDALFIMRPLNPNVRGVFLQVKDPQNPPPLASVLADGIRTAPMEVKMAPNPSFGIENFVLTIGLP